MLTNIFNGITFHEWPLRPHLDHHFINNIAVRIKKRLTHRNLAHLPRRYLANTHDVVDLQRYLLWLTFNQYGVAYDGRTSMGDNANGLAEWAGESTATGKWAGALTERLGYGDLFCRVMFYRDWRRWMLEKVVYGAVVNIVGALHPKSDGKPSTHADVANYFSEEVEQMVDELGYTLRGYMAVTLLSGSSGRICAVAEANGRDVPCEVTPASFALYNKLFWDNSMLARDRGFPDTCSMHTEYVEYGIEKKNIDPEVIVEKKKKYY